ncbi:tyrosine-protein phosphatase [Xylocopilactobacillus apicola]|uniref:Aldo/keto reductase n=1 Tax=Xylocopilactobacillus apicola TaxID=2932184 RepID=A0AAU9DKM3_9LACO|nr:tyrosine-protein phosphatase [Xylocopilactobacillus apicola]BDR59101.1 aldo/keto reductase [Xylocopilactobacillus apicola]
MELVNFRDLGGIPNKQGLKVKPKRVLRSGKLVDLDQLMKDQLVNDYQLKQVIDLRKRSEIEKEPDDQLPGVKNINLDILEMNKNRGLGFHAAADTNDPDVVTKEMEDMYQEIVLNPQAQKHFGEFLELLLENKTGSTLFHCYSGKDRTGIAAAIFLWLLDVDDEEVMKDYMQTNVDRKPENDRIIARMKKEGYEGKALEAVLVTANVEASYLKCAQDTIIKQYGDILNYAEQALNFDSSKIEKLQKLYLE